MMILAIITFAIEMLILIITNTVSQLNGGQLSGGYSLFVVFVFVMCSLLALLALLSSVKEIRSGYSKAKGVVGTIFASVALLMGAIFLITFTVTLFTLLNHGPRAYICLFY